MRNKSWCFAFKQVHSYVLGALLLLSAEICKSLKILELLATEVMKAKCLNSLVIDYKLV